MKEIQALKDKPVKKWGYDTVAIYSPTRKLVGWCQVPNGKRIKRQ